MSLRDVQTIHVTNMLARDSVILLLSAIKMVNTDLFTSSLVHFRRPVRPKKCFMLSRIVMFVKEPSTDPCAVQIGSSRSGNTVERRILKTIILNRK